MIIPSLEDVRNSAQSGKVEAQCKECARLLARHLYLWRKPYPEKSKVKSGNAKSLSFTGMDIEVFANYLMEHFSLKTQDAREWPLDRSIAALIWNACTEDGSPLPEASSQIEMDL
jgi:hypothetical protein